MVSVGGKYAVSNAGGMKLSGFFAMAMKHLINLHYLLGVAGIN
jgi:NADH dehydrogenase